MIWIVPFLLGLAFFTAMPIAVLFLLIRTRALQRRIDALERQAVVHREWEAPAVTEQPVRVVPIAPVEPLAPVASVQPAGPAEPLHAAAPIAPAAPVPPVPAVEPVEPVEPEPREPVEPLEPRVPKRESLETAIGTRWFLYLGVVAIVVGGAYFEKLAIDRGWIGETARVIQGALVGLCLMYAGTRFVKRGYTLYGQVMAGGGGAILYLSTYAAFNLYALIERATAFALMVAITALIAWLADRQRSQGLALFAVGGGFATPFLLPGTTDAQIALFTYDAILIAGTAVLSHRRDWPFLHLVSYLFTLVTVAGWADRFYSSEKYLRTELYLTLYCGMFIYIANECRRLASSTGKFVWLMLCTAPVAYYLASVTILSGHDVALIVWLVSLMLLGGVVASRVGPSAGLGVWVAVAIPLLLWCTTANAQSMRREGLIALAAVYVIALLAELEGTIFRDNPREPGAADIAWVHLNPLVMFAGVYLLTTPVSLVNAGYGAGVFGLWQVAIAAGLWRRRANLAVHFLAVGFTLGAIAIALIFSGPEVTAGWAVEGAVVITLAIRQRLGWLRAAGILLFAIAVGQTVDLLAIPAPVGHVIFFNARVACAALVIALCYGLAWQDAHESELPYRKEGLGAALLTAQLVTLVALTSEINAYWDVRNGHFARELMLSITWGVYATVLVVIGLARGYAPIRYLAITVLVITIGKVFFVDMAELDRIYRVGSVVGLGVLLLVTSFLYSRSRKGD